MLTVKDKSVLLCDNIKKAIKNSGYTVEEFVQKAGYDESFVKKIYEHPEKLSSNDVIRISEILNINESSLFDF